MTTSFYYSEANLGLVIAEKSTQQAWTGIQEIDENSQNFIPGQKLGQVDNLACSGIASLQNLAIPTTENIFQNLRVRYYRDQIYTECGEQVLLILNPHKPLNIYDELLIQYKLSKQNDKQPHIYKITEQAKAAIFNQPQKAATILLTGQSGAGKTVSTKHVLKYIAKESKSGTFQSVLGVDVIPIDVQITQTNILFEALGNASTAKNNNSSRFGKLVQIQFNNQKLITSGRIQIHLFEKIRLTKLNYQDRNFHIFYQLLAGYQNRNLLSDVEKHLKFESLSCVDFQELANRLGELQLDYDFLLLGNSKPTENDLQNFLLLCDSLELLKFKEEEIYEIFELLAGLLHLGGVQNPPETYNLFTCAEKLLQIPNLEEEFRKEEMKSVAVGKSLESASAVHGFIVHVYSQLFEWIVNRVNGQLSTGFVQENQNILNVFDGFGFETIENEQGVQQNHLEQMILNYTCEKLQSYFFDSIVKYEQTPYINEGIKWKKIQLDLNDTLVKLFDEVIFTSLSDCTQIGGVTDQHFLDTIKKACPLKPKHEQRNVPQFSDLLIRDCHTNLQQSKKILSQSSSLADRKILGIKHSNGEVYYNMNQFLQRNKYAISEQRQSITKQSSNTVVKGFQVVKYTTTLVKNAQLSLKQLLQLFQSTVPFFVKCILPNNVQRSRTFDGPSVLKQLIESGVQQTAQLLTELYHFKVPIPEFFKNYSLIFKKVKVNGAVQIDLAKQFLQGSSEYQHIFLVDPPLLQFGENIVFMQKAVKALLDSHQQKLLANFIAWGIKQFRTRIINKKKKKIQEPQFGVIPQENQVQEEEPQIVVEQPPSYEELLNKLQETEAQLAIFQRLYQQEIQKNQNQQESLALAMLDKINGKIEILLQRSEPQQEFVSTIY